MTNAEKFIEVMNKYFDAGLTKNNLLGNDVEARPCTPCGIFRRGACDTFYCDECANWWEKEWKPKHRWQEVKGDYMTPGGDPLYSCPVCDTKESWHIYGVEHTKNYSHKCPVCGTELLYPWEKEEKDD